MGWGQVILFCFVPILCVIPYVVLYSCVCFVVLLLGLVFSQVIAEWDGGKNKKRVLLVRFF